MPALWRTQANRVHSVAVELCWRPAGSGRAGDFHDVVDLLDGRVAIVVGDAAAIGGGIDVAEELKFLLRRALLGGSGGAPALEAADEVVRRSGATATAVCVVLDPDIRRADVTNAGHVPVLATSSGGARFLQQHIGQPLGTAAHRRTVAYPLEEDTSLYLFTDGLVVRPEVPVEEGLVALLRSSRDLTGGAASATELARRATDRLGEPLDDASVISARLRPTPRHSGVPGRHPLDPATVVLRLYSDPLDRRASEVEKAIRTMASRLVPEIEVRLEVVDATEATDSLPRQQLAEGPVVVRVEPPPLLTVTRVAPDAAALARSLQLPWDEGV